MKSHRWRQELSEAAKSNCGVVVSQQTWVLTSLETNQRWLTTYPLTLWTNWCGPRGSAPDPQGQRVVQRVQL
jgi:hypothetical protein